MQGDGPGGAQTRRLQLDSLRGHQRAQGGAIDIPIERQAVFVIGAGEQQIAYPFADRGRRRNCV